MKLTPEAKFVFRCSKHDCYLDVSWDENGPEEAPKLLPTTSRIMEHGIDVIRCVTWELDLDDMYCPRNDYSYPPKTPRCDEYWTVEVIQ